MNRKNMNRHPRRVLRMGGVLLPLVWTLGTTQVVGAATSTTPPGSSTSVDPDAPLRPKLSAAELERLGLSLEAQAEQVRVELNTARTRLGLGPDDELRVMQAQLDPYGTAHIRLEQYHRGIPVLGMGMVAHRDGTSATETYYLAPFLSVDTEPTIDEAQARSIAIAASGLPSTEPLLTEVVLAIEPLKREWLEPDAAGGVTNSEQARREVVGYRLVYLAQVAPEEDEEPEAPSGDAPTGVPPSPAPSRATDAYSLDELEPEQDGSRVPDSKPVLVDAPVQVVIDAETGRIVSQRQDVSHAGQAVTSLGHSYYHGDVELSTRYDTGDNRYELQDPFRGGNQVRDLRNGTKSRLKKSYLYRGTDNDWGDGEEFQDGDATGSARGETSAVDVAYAIERTWDLLHKVYGRKGLDGKGTAVRARVHYGHNYSDAHWNNFYKAPYFGDGRDSGLGTPSNTGLDTVGHELGHGLWLYELGKWGGALSDGINEGHGDILGSLTEFYTYGHQGLGFHVPDTRAGWNWKGRMINPEGYTEKNGNGDVRHGLRYWTSNISNEPEHVIGTLYGHAFVFLAHGASSNPDSTRYSVYLPNGMAGIGADRAGELWYLATTAYLPKDPGFNALRTAYLSAAKQIYGEGTRMHNAVKDAFGAVGVGYVAADNTVPEILETHLDTVDEGEGTAFVVASVTDDTGVLRTSFRTGSHERVSEFSPASAYLDISPLSLGSHLVYVKAEDRTLKTAQKTLPMLLVGANQLLTNGNFEAGTTGWSASAGVLAKHTSSRPVPFMGYWSSAFSASGSLSQAVSIPADATSVPLSFRYRVEPNATEAAKLSVLVKDLGTGVQTMLAAYDRQDVNYFPAGRAYRRARFDLASFRGRTVQLLFVSSAGTGEWDFSVDSVSMTYTAPVKVNAPAFVLNEDEQTLRFTFKGLSGYAPHRIRKVEYVVGGEVKATTSGGGSHTTVISIKGWPTGSTSVVARVYDYAGALVGQSPAVALTLKGTKQALVNGDFEAGTASWLLSGSASVGTDSEGVYQAFLGQRYGRLGGKGILQEGTLSQTVGLPADLLSAQWSYRVQLDTKEDNAGGTDTLQMEAQVLPDGEWQVLEVIDANDDISTGDTFYGYQKRTVNLTAFKGKTVRLRFRVRENAGLATTYRIDNVSVTYTQLIISN
ncbi:M4 family metallopeptidase [Archangium violaceum]|uniref:M4 family metallopeptidase n=1 Tax=Archangium violaceum TaxID=83451 RepID=UPI002B317866|nr:M4 family metallopeptidase [Archangium gephyra]